MRQREARPRAALLTLEMGVRTLYILCRIPSLISATLV